MSDKRSIAHRSHELITADDPNSSISEAYRNIMTNLKYSSPDKTLKTILVTSPSAKAGKSFIVANLGVSLSQNGKKVIVIDSDFRKPMLNHFFKMPNFNGLSNLLSGEITYEEAIKDTGIEGLKILNTGVHPPNPIKLLESKKMEEVLKQVRSEADVVLIDSAPIIPVSDTSIMANKADGVIIVVASQETQQDLLLKTVDKLEKVNSNIIGTIINKYQSRKKGYGYYNGYSYY